MSQIPESTVLIVLPSCAACYHADEQADVIVHVKGSGAAPEVELTQALPVRHCLGEGVQRPAFELQGEQAGLMHQGIQGSSAGAPL